MSELIPYESIIKVIEHIGSFFGGLWLLLILVYIPLFFLFSWKRLSVVEFRQNETYRQFFEQYQNDPINSQIKEQLLAAMETYYEDIYAINIRKNGGTAEYKYSYFQTILAIFNIKGPLDDFMVKQKREFYSKMLSTEQDVS
jgi:hypothetical protein